MAKGSKRRPMRVKREEFDRNWDEIFPRKTWTHKCDNIVVTLEKSVPCPYCGEKFDGTV